MISNTSEKSFVEKTQCTGLEAKELLGLAQALSREFYSLAGKYSSDHVTKTRDYLSELRDHANQDRLGRLLGGKPSLSYTAKNMWQQFKKTEAAVNAFKNANGMLHTGLDVNRCLTACFESLEHGRSLSNSNVVVEGRRVYESLSGHSSLCTQLDL